MQNDENGRYCIAWSEKEHSGDVEPFFNIGLRVFDQSGNVLASIDRDQLAPFHAVNQPASETPLSNQLSPAVDFDACGNIVVTWVGRSPPGAAAQFNVYARRLYFDDSTNSLHFLGDQFIVNSDDGWELGNDPDLVHPTVTMTPSGALPEDQGRFFIAWNANTTAQDPDSFLMEQNAFQWGVRGQLFSPDMLAVGPNFDVSPNPTPDDFESFDGFDRTLAASGQHTIDYGPKLRKVATWTAINSDDPPAAQVRDVWITSFASVFGGSLEDYFEEQDLICVKGDLDGDLAATLADLPAFVAVLLSTQPHFMGYADLCPADTNADGLADGRDIQCFVNLLLGHTSSACNIIGNPCSEGFDPPEQLVQDGTGGVSEGMSESAPADADASPLAGADEPQADEAYLDAETLALYLEVFDWAAAQDWTVEGAEYQTLLDALDVRMGERGLPWGGSIP